MPPTRPILANVANRSQDGWDDPVHGRVSWHTLVSADIAATDSLSAGVAAIEAGCRLNLHRHAQAELDFIVAGEGVVTIDGVEMSARPSDAIFIPGGAEHGVRNDAQAELRFFYVFAANSFADVVYRFPGDPDAPGQ